MFQALALPHELNTKFQAHVERTRAYFSQLGKDKPEAIILGGGYGRGEGGVAVDAEGKECFFNDLDYFIFTSHPDDPFLLNAVSEWEREESRAMGIDVEGKCLPKSQLENTATSMMFYDLVSAHTVVLGPDDYLAVYRYQANSETISPVEATRLLWNRGSGLLFARRDLAFDGDLNVVHRNQAKAKLALGDALLTIRGKYRPFVRERQSLLKEESRIDPRISQLHEEGVAFKLRPTPTPEKQILLDTQAELTKLWTSCFLEVESIRLETAFSETQEYALYKGKLFPDASTVRNCLLAVRDRLRRKGYLKPVTDYPRGALQRALVTLLEPEPDFEKAGHFLSASIQDLNQAVNIYSKWWHYYS